LGRALVAEGWFPWVIALMMGVSTRCPPYHALGRTGKVALKSLAMSKVAIFGDFVRFLAKRKRYWLLPMALTLILLGLLVALTEGSAVAPFIYTLF
jgi:hypothetical protein